MLINKVWNFDSVNVTLHMAVADNNLTGACRVMTVDVNGRFVTS